MKNKKIKAIIFDFVGVLLRRKNNYKPDKLLDEIDKLIGRTTDDQKFKKEILKKFQLDESEFKKILEKITDKYEAFKPLWQLLPQLKKTL